MIKSWQQFDHKKDRIRDIESIETGDQELDSWSPVSHIFQ